MSTDKLIKKQGVLHGCVAEIIPIEPDADNAAAGIVSFYTYTLFVINETVFYLVLSFEKLQ